jgi:putative transposase
VKYVRKWETLKTTIDFLINEIKTMGFKIKGLYLDREFYTIAVYKLSYK